MTVWFVGEAMLELSRERGTDAWRMRFAGDTLNTALHIARQGIPTGYLTALGHDPYSAEMIAEWRREGLGTEAVMLHPSRQPGLYAIDTDAAGERTFTYWREHSAVRELFSLRDIDTVLAKIADASLLAFSLITLAVLPPDARARLLDLCREVRRRGGRVAFDGNYRARLWPSTAEAREARDAAIAVADIGLPTLEDELALQDAKDTQEPAEVAAAAVAAHWQARGCAEVVVKLGAAGCLLGDGTLVPPPAIVRPVDTSGAGDAFNGGYLAARLRGENPRPAAEHGHRLAGWVVMQRGALPPRTPDAPYAV